MKVKIVALFAIFLCGCAGSGFNKKVTLMPDEFYVAVSKDLTDHNSNHFADKITGGVKWKLK